jgi:hypothetical protein
VTSEPNFLHRKAAYIETVRALGRRARNAGFVACLLGVLLLVWARVGSGAPVFVLWIALAVIAVGWGLLVWSVIKRVGYIRSHPFESES